MFIKFISKSSFSSITFVNTLLVAIIVGQVSTNHAQNSFKIKTLKVTRSRYATANYSARKTDFAPRQNKINLETGLLHGSHSSSSKKNPIIVSKGFSDFHNNEVSAKSSIISSSNTSPTLNPFAKRLQNAIDEKLGIRYRYNGEDSNGYDCSGFVWSTFRDVGVLFNRSSAANYFNSFPEASPEERSKFGTLIFFNGLGHVGIVKDENHFYHASLSKGIVLSNLDSYWQARLTGYRSIIKAVTAPSSITSKKLSKLEEQLEEKETAQN